MNERMNMGGGSLGLGCVHFICKDGLGWGRVSYSFYTSNLHCFINNDNNGIITLLCYFRVKYSDFHRLNIWAGS